MAEFKLARVLFHVMAQGSIEVDVEVGVETAEQRFRSLFTPNKYALEALQSLVQQADDLDWVITCATEPRQECQHIYVFGSSVCSLCGDVLTVPCVENYVPLHPGPGEPPDSHADEDMARRDQFQAEQEELSRSIDQMLRGGRD